MFNIGGLGMGGGLGMPSLGASMLDPTAGAGALPLDPTMGGGGCPLCGGGGGLTDGFSASPELAMAGIPPADASLPPDLSGGGSLANQAAMAQLGASDANIAGTIGTSTLAGGMKAGAQQQQLLADASLLNPLLAGLNANYGF